MSLLPRRNFFATARNLVAAGGVASQIRPLQAAAIERGEDYYDKLGVTKIINAAGTYTALTASIMPPSVQAAVARAARASPWRVALVASSSWSHAFLVAKNDLVFPDVEADRRYYEALKNCDIDLWRNTTLEEVEDRGHHELLNWFCLLGAMSELGRNKPDASVFLESWITNSDKVFAVYRPPFGGRLDR